MAEAKPKVVLAYSGGLDTSIILKWLQDEGYEVICYVADVGQDDDFEAARAKAIKLGASEVFVEDLKKEFVEDFIFTAIKFNAIYEGRYLLGTSLARPVIAKRQIEVAKRVGASYVSHGATGKGNDQVIAPWRDAKFIAKFKGRSDLLAYGREKGIPLPEGERPPYSMDDNMMHISYESGVLEDPAVAGEEKMYLKTLPRPEWADKEQICRIHFVDGAPVKVECEGKTVEGSVDLYIFLNELARRHGIGRMDLVENRFVGIKSRGIYETPAATILRAAHLDIEGVAMDREVMRLRDLLGTKFSELCYNGFWFAPEMDFLLAALSKSQELIDGWVDCLCYKGSVMAVARASPTALYDADLASMESVSAFDPADSGGFIRINAIRLKAHRAICERRAARIHETGAHGVTYDGIP